MAGRRITFTLAVQGEKKLIDSQQDFAREIEKSVKALEAMGTTHAQQAAKMIREQQKLRAELAATEKQARKVAAALGASGQGTGNSGGGGRRPPKAKEFEDLIQRANEFRAANDRAADELRTLRQAARQGAGRTDEEYRQLIDRIAELNAAQQDVTAEIREQTREYRAQSFAAGSYRELNQTLGRLRAEWRDMSEEARNGLAGSQHLEQIQRLDMQLRGLDQQLGITTRNVGNYNGAIDRLSGILAAVKGFEVFGLGVQEVVEANANISDAIADVRKTTNLSTEALQGYDDIIIQLQESLKALDTRTSLADLLDISRIGGQLGVGKEFVDQFERLNALGDTEGAAQALAAAQAELEGFTTSVNQINVALGDELGGNVEAVAGDIGKLNEILKVSAELGTERGLLAIGSAINTLGASGAANAEQVVSFTKRVGNIAPQANIAASDVLGLGAALDEFGQAPELAATAVQKLLISIGKDVPRFAKIAGVSVKDLSTLLKEDGNEAFLTVLAGAQSSGGGLEDLAKLLEDFGITSERATGVLGALTGNLDRVKELQALAGEQFAIARGELEGTLSVTEEYNIKNATLGAELEKLRNSFVNLVVNTGFQEFLASGIRGLVSFVRGLAAVPSFIKENQAALAALGVALIAFNINSIAAAAATLKLAIANKRKAISDGVATASQWLLNAAMNANPVGIVIGLLGLLVGAIIYVANNTNEFTERVKSAWRQVLEFYNSNLLVKAVLFQIIEPIKAIIFLVKNWSAVFAGAQAAVLQFVDNVKAGFSELVSNAQIVGLQVQKFLTFDGELKASLDKEIKALRESRDAVLEGVKPVAEAFTQAYNDAQRQARDKALADERAAQAARAAESARLANEKGKSDAEAEADGYKQKFNEKERKRLQELEKQRLDAAKRIRALELEVLEDETARKAGQAIEGAGNDLSGLVGDPEQLTRQAELIQERLDQELGKLYAAAREKAQAEALADIQEIGETKGLLPTPEQIAEQGEAITQQLQGTLAGLFDQQRSQLVAGAENSIAALAGDPESVAAQSEAIRAQLAKDLEALEVQRQAFGQQQEENERVRQNVLLQIRLESLQQEFEAETLAREQALLKKVEDIAAGADAEVEAGKLAQEVLAEAEEENRQAQLEAEIDFEKQRLEAMTELGLNTIDIQRDIAQKQIDLEKSKVDQILQENKRLEDGQRVALGAALGVLGDFVAGAAQLLGEDEENRRQHGAIIKALSVAEIAINLQREISAINAANSTYPEPFASFIKGAAIASAILRSTLATAQVLSQQFEYGGVLPDQGLSATYVGTDGQLRSKGVHAPLEGINEAWQGPAVHSGLDGYRPAGSMYVVGQGYVPEHGGQIMGPGHDQGGVKVRNKFGNLMEFEGGEWLLKNGPETYIINRRSSALFRKDLLRMRSNSGVYSPRRRQMASQINAFNGWGLKFHKGGALKRYQAGGVVSEGVSPATALGTVIAQPPQAVPTAGQRADTRLLEALETANSLTMESIDKANERIEQLRGQVLTMKVFNNPGEMVKEGLKQLQDEENAGGFGSAE